jgi:hypothetical protein
MAVDPGGIPRLADVQLNGWMFAFASLLAVASASSQDSPALQTPISDVVPVLRQGQRAPSAIAVIFGCEMPSWSPRLRSLTLLAGAGLLVRSPCRC